MPALAAQPARARWAGGSTTTATVEGRTSSSGLPRRASVSVTPGSQAQRRRPTRPDREVRAQPPLPDLSGTRSGGQTRDAVQERAAPALREQGLQRRADAVEPVVGVG